MLNAIVRYVCDDGNLDRYTKEAIQKSEFKKLVGDEAKTSFIVKHLYSRISEKLTENGFSLQNVIDDPSFYQKFQSHRRLQAVLEYYKKNRGSEHAANPGASRYADGYAGSSTAFTPTLDNVARDVFNKRDELWRQVTSKNPDQVESQDWLNFLNRVRAKFREHGYSFSQILQPENARIQHQYFSSGRLGLALAIYKKLLELSKQPQEVKVDESDFRDDFYAQQAYDEEDVRDDFCRGEAYSEKNARDEVHRQEAHDAARADALGEQGLVTRLGMKGVGKDQLKKQARQMMFAHHPDRVGQDEGNEAVFNDAALLKRLLDQDLFDDYKAELGQLRGRGPR